MKKKSPASGKSTAPRASTASRALESAIAEARDQVKLAKKKSKLAKAQLKEARAKLKSAKRARKDALAKARAAVAARRTKAAARRSESRKAAKPARTRKLARLKAVRAPVPENGSADAVENAPVEVTLPVDSIESDVSTTDPQAA